MDFTLTADQAELATAAKSRFLAAASHDLRQPLQTLALVQGLLAKNVETDKARRLVGRLELHRIACRRIEQKTPLTNPDTGEVGQRTVGLSLATRCRGCRVRLRSEQQREAQGDCSVRETRGPPAA